MKLLCSQKDLSQAINTVQRAVSQRTTMPILKGILLETSGDKLKLIGNDLELGIETYVDAQTIEEGSVIIDSKLFGEIVRKLPESYIHIESDEQNNITIKCEHSEFTLKGHSPVEYPQLPELDEGLLYDIEPQKLKDMIRQTVFAISQDETKPLLMGELFEIQGNSMSLVALDGYRLAISTSTIENTIGDISVIIPGKALMEINRTISGEEESMSMSFTQKHALFKLGSTRIITRLLEGEFINYKQIIPKDNSLVVTSSRKELQDSIERASLLAREGRNNLIKFSITDGLMIITSNSEVGNVYEEVNVTLEGGNLEIAFNSRYLLDSLKVLESEEMNMYFSSSVSPCVIKPADNPGYTYMLLPVRISSGS